LLWILALIVAILAIISIFVKQLRAIMQWIFVIAMIALSIYFGFGGPAFACLPFLSGWAGVAVCMGAAFLAAPDQMKQVMDKVGDAAEVVAETAGNVAGSVASGLLSGVLSNPLVLVGCGFLVWYLLSRNGKTDASDEKSQTKVDTTTSSPMISGDSSYALQPV
jgi:hypothetical protein